MNNIKLINSFYFQYIITCPNDTEILDIISLSNIKNNKIQIRDMFHTFMSAI